MAILAALGKLRSVIGSDPYALTFQNFGQYRTALLKHIDNLAAAHAAGEAAAPAQCERDTAETFAQELIAQGWHNSDPECVVGLQVLLVAVERSRPTASGVADLKGGDA